MHAPARLNASRLCSLCNASTACAASTATLGCATVAVERVPTRGPTEDCVVGDDVRVRVRSTRGRRTLRAEVCGGGGVSAVAAGGTVDTAGADGPSVFGVSRSSLDAEPAIRGRVTATSVE